MNTGILSSRYAKALLMFVQETGNGDKVYSQAGVLLLRMGEIAQLKDYIQFHEEISLEKKLKLLDAAVGEPLAAELDKFVRLLAVRRRMEYFMRMLYSFVAQYREAGNIKAGRLVTALPADGLRERLEAAFGEKTGAEVHIEARVNPEITGGFVFEIDGLRLDASVERQFRLIRRTLIEKNNRLV